MATPGATIADRITDLIGSDYATVPSLSYKDLINAAFNEVADMVQENLLLKYSATPTNVTSASGVSIEDKKILKVIRVDANSNGIAREAFPLAAAEYSVAADSGSIHYATNFSPVYTIYSINTASTVLIYPDCNSSGQVGRIWFFSYATNSTNLTGIDAAELNTDHFLPSTLIHAIVLKSCINILNAYLSNQVQDEEDLEIQGMLNTQKAALQQDFAMEMQRFMPEGSSSKVGAE